MEHETIPPRGGRRLPRLRTVIGGAVVGITIIALAAVLGVAWSWRVRREAARQALHEHLLFTAHVVGDEIVRLSAERRWALLAPVMGRPAAPLAADAMLDTLVGHVARTLEAGGPAGDPYLGAFRMERAPDPEDPALRVTGTRGAVAAEALRAATVAAIRARLLQPGDISSGEPLLAFLHVDGRQVGNVVFVQVRRSARDPGLLVGVTYGRALSTRRAVEAALAAMPALPPTLARAAGVPVVPSTRVVRRLNPDSTDPGARESEPDATRRLVGTRFLTMAGETLYASPGWPPARWRTPYRARVAYESRPGGFMLEMAMDPAIGDRLVHAAVLPAERWIVGALALLAGLLAAAAALGLRRERQLEKLRTRFVASVSHELRTPLTQICAFSDLLLQDPATLARDATQQRWLAIINREAHRLATMVESVLLTARDDGGRLRVLRRPCDASEIADDVRVAMQPVAASRGSTVRVVAPRACPVHVDPGALRQMLLNMVDNALKYGPERQEVVVTVHPLASDGTLRITVDDQGAGVAVADRARVWEAYERLQRHDGVTGGSGLGLSVVRTLVRQHGGRVAVDDAPGGGARFAIAIPEADRGPAPGAASPALAAASTD